MEVIFFTNFSKRKNSTKRPNDAEGVVREVRLKGQCDLSNPMFFLKDVSSYTYCKAWGNYYFIHRIGHDIDGAEYVYCNIDVLASWKNQIFATTAFVEYSTSNYNKQLKDPRCKPYLSKTFDERENQSELFLTRNHENECVILTCMGMIGLQSWILDERSLQTLMAEVSIAGREEGEALQMQFGDALGSIISAQRIPIEPSMIPSTGPELIYLGFYNTGYEATYLYGEYTMERGDVEIPWQYDDFRNGAPYTELYLELPYVGVVPLDSSDFIGERGVIIQTCVNVRNGHIDYRICSGSVNHVVANFSGTCGGTIEVAASQIANPRRVVDGVLSVSKNAISPSSAGVVAGMVKDIADIAMDLQQDSISIIGSYSGGYGETLNTKYRCITICHNTNEEPSNLASLYGRPCMKVLQIGSLTGYVKTSGFSIDIDALDVVRDMINSAMDSGVYLE